MTKLPRISHPFEPGLYVFARPRCVKFVGEVTDRGGVLWFTCSATNTDMALRQLDHADFNWWGPFILNRR